MQENRHSTSSGSAAMDDKPKPPYSAALVEDMLVELTGTDRSGAGLRAVVAMKKKDKAALTERLFPDSATQAAWQIDAETKARINTFRPTCFQETDRGRRGSAALGKAHASRASDHTMTDLTAHAHPVLAVACPTCGARASTCCRSPGGHAASELYQSRRIEADRLFIEQHSDMAAIIRAAPGGLIDPRGRVRD